MPSLCKERKGKENMIFLCNRTKEKEEAHISQKLQISYPTEDISPANKRVVK
jgi:hypothetical protein